MQTCRKTKIAAFLVVTILYIDVTFGQNAAILTGEMDSIADGTVVKVESNMGYHAKTVIKNNAYKFVIPLNKQWDAYYIECSNKKENFFLPILLKEDSKLHIKVDKSFYNYILTGDSIADEQNGFWKGVHNIFKDYQTVFKQKTETKDSVIARRLQAKIDAMDAEGKNYEKDWVTTHKSSPFSCTIIRMFLDRSNITRAEDTTAEKYYDMLAPMAKENNYQATLLQNEFAMYNVKYSNNQVGNAISKDIFVKDTSGENHQPERLQRQICVDRFLGKLVWPV